MDSSDPQATSRDRQHERAADVEDLLREVELDFGDLKYPVTTEEVASTYGTSDIDMPNETESLGDVLDRLDPDEYQSATQLREVLAVELDAADLAYFDEEQLAAQREGPATEE